MGARAPAHCEKLHKFISKKPLDIHLSKCYTIIAPRGRALRQDGVAPRKQGFEAHQVAGKQRSDTAKKIFKTLLTSPPICGIMNIVKRERRRAARVMVYLRGCQSHKRKIKCRKPLDKPTNLWYNVNVSERENSTTKPCRY